MIAAITIDVDWAPDFAIDWVAEQLVARSVPATWFLTHESAAVDRLRQRPDLFDLGIHPNFSPGSTHGATPAEVLRHCLAIVPGARIMRTHQLVQSTPLLAEVMRTTPIIADCSLFLPHATAVETTVLWYDGRPLVRIPYIWEDDLEVERPRPVWRLHDMVRPRLPILSFHPIHLFLNSISMDAYRHLKAQARVVSDIPASKVLELIASGPGPRTMFDDLVSVLSGQAGGRLTDIVHQVLAT